jgi:hypothetical protein
LLLAATEQPVVGLMAQKTWASDIRQQSQRYLHATRPYQEKESDKWEGRSREVAEMTRVISTIPVWRKGRAWA